MTASDVSTQEGEGSGPSDGEASCNVGRRSKRSTKEGGHTRRDPSSGQPDRQGRRETSSVAAWNAPLSLSMGGRIVEDNPEGRFRTQNTSLVEDRYVFTLILCGAGRTFGPSGAPWIPPSERRHRSRSLFLFIETFRFKITGSSSSIVEISMEDLEQGGTNPVRFVFRVSVRNQQQHDHKTRANASLAAAHASPSTHPSHERRVQITWDRKDPSQSRSVRRNVCRRAARTKVRTTGPGSTNTSETKQAPKSFHRRLEHEPRGSTRSQRNDTEEFKQSIGRATLLQSDRTSSPKENISRSCIRDHE